jgi:hypothetical protein
MGSVSEWFRSWRLVSWRSAIVAAVVLYALIGFLVVPWIVKSLIEKKSVELVKRQATVVKVRCNPFALSLTIEGFSIPDRPGSVLLSWDRVYANAQISSLFRWAATLKELTIENPYVALRRFEDGTVNVLEVMEDLPEPEPKPPEDEGGLPRALLQQIRVVDARVDLEDRYNRPETLLWEIGPSQVELLDISTIPNREGTNDVMVQLPGGGTIAIAGDVVVEPLGLNGTFTLENNELASMWRAVGHLFEFELTSGVIDLELDYQIGLEEDGPHLVVDDTSVHITDFGFKSDLHEDELLLVDDIRVAGAHLEWPEQNVAAESVLIEGATAFGWIEPDGTPNWDVLIPEESQKEIVATYQTLEERIQASAELGRFEIRDAGVQFENRVESPPMLFEITDANLVVTDISTKEGSLWPFEASATLEGDALGTAKGTFGAAPVAAEVEVSLEGLQLAKYQPFIARIAPLEVRAGVLHAGGTATASKPKGAEALEANFKGEFGVTGLDLNETVTGDKLLGWGDLSVKGIDADLEPIGAMVTEVDIYNAGLQITVAEDGTINLLEFFGALTEGEEEAGDGGAAASGAEGLPPLVIARFRLHDCYGVYTDKTPSSGPFQMALKPINGTISGISTRSKAGAKLDIEAGIDVGGGVRVGGELDPFDYQRLTDLSIDVRDLQLPAVSPMSVKFIGYPIDNGDVSLDLDYDIVDRYLTAYNLIEADDLELGDKVEGEGMINLPFKLGVSLLKDKEGRITLEVPFEGSFDNPGFGMLSAAGAAGKEIFTELVKSPFKMLGKIGGGGDQDLEFVEFAGGSVELADGARRNLDTLAGALAERPTLALTINGTYDPEVDRPGLQLAALREELLAQGVTEEEFDTIIPLDKLESLYSSRHSAAEFDALQAQYTSAAEAEGTEPVFDEVAYRDGLREALIASQPVDPGMVAALAPARVEAIRAYLVEQAGLDPARVRVAPEPTVEEPEEKETAATGSERWVRCKLELAAG